jgi:glycosyltransferase involved in cell wall biosynthesis
MPILQALDDALVRIGQNDIVCIVRVHNEALRLPYFLEYHRNLGVGAFLFIDDQSNDGTIEYLRSQATLHGDVYIFSPAGSYKDARGGLDWCEALADEYADDRWILFLDTDELFAYPGCENKNLHSLVEFLENEQSEAVFSFMLDMFPAGAVGANRYQPGLPFSLSAPMFDPNYKFLRRWRKPFRAQRSPKTMVIGGVRLRIFYPQLVNCGSFGIVIRQLVGSANRRLHRIGLELPLDSALPPALEKIPFRKWSRGRSRLYTSHHSDAVRLSSVTSVLLHYKFFSDFRSKVEAAIIRGQHWNNAIEYKKYAVLIDNGEELFLPDERSLTYRSSQQLMQLGLLNAPKSWIDE